MLLREFTVATSMALSGNQAKVVRHTFSLTVLVQSWSSYNMVLWVVRLEIMELWGIIGKCKGFRCKYIPREENSVAHNLANLGMV